MTKKKTAKTTRKNCVFSVSFRDDDLAELQEYIDQKKKETGYSPTRNQLIRRATLAHIRHEEKPSIPYEEVFKSIE